MLPGAGNRPARRATVGVGRAAARHRAGVAYDRRVTPLILLALGVALLAAGGVILRSFGPRGRVGRLLATTPAVSFEEAHALADQAAARYVRVSGRIDSDEEFEDQDHRPLVLRRTRLQARAGRGWRTVDDNRESVPFELHEGLRAIEIDADRLDAGLVVVPRESVGVAADVPGRVPTDLPPDTPVRVWIEQVSSVEHAIALGVPTRDGDAVRLTEGLGRPLVLTTLEQPEAMRILAEGGTARPRIAAALLATGLGVSAAAVVWAILETIL